jgi:hypothetical protein
VQTNSHAVSAVLGTAAGAAGAAAAAAAAVAAAGAVAAGFASSAAKAGEVTITLVEPIAKAIAPPARSCFIQVNILNLSLKC